MKKIILLAILPALVIILLAGFGGGDGSKYPSGAPAGYTGSPFDGKDCSISSCHGGSSIAVTNWISSDIPGTGYVAGSSYTITVTVQGTGSENKGFEVSPQKTDGTLLGTLTVGTGSKVEGTNNAYITHSAAKTTNPAVWTFTWTAPAAGTGPVTFYGAFVDGYSHVSHLTLTVQESTTSVQNLDSHSGINVFPNPANVRLNYSWNLKYSGHVNISIRDLTGKLIYILMDKDQPAGLISGSFSLGGKIKAGVYLLNYSVGYLCNGVEKIIVQ